MGWMGSVVTLSVRVVPTSNDRGDKVRGAEHLRLETWCLGCGRGKALPRAVYSGERHIQPLRPALALL